VRGPSSKQEPPREDKDPDVWDPPSPPKNKKKVSNWGQQKRSNNAAVKKS